MRRYVKVGGVNKGLYREKNTCMTNWMINKVTAYQDNIPLI